MKRLLSFLLALAVGIALVLLVGVVFLPVVAGILIVWGLLALLSPRRTAIPPDPEDDGIPADQAVIDVQAVEVVEEDSDRK